ncbi:MAG: hypothetical protein IKR11_06625 [Solobacterium sp.]|nr:hypothetical protein [Solobacterium sp.]
MKRIMKFILCMNLALSLTGCKDTKKAAHQIADQFFTSIEQGNNEEAENYLVREAASQFDQYISVSSMIDDFRIPGIEYTQETEDSLNELLTNITQKMIKNHTIEDVVKNEDKTYTVTVSLDIVNTDNLSAVLRNMDLTEFSELYAVDLEKLKDITDEREAVSGLMGLTFLYINEKIDTFLETAGYDTKTITVTVIKENDSYVICDIGNPS